jgi:hypothetical protein
MLYDDIIKILIDNKIISIKSKECAIKYKLHKNYKNNLNDYATYTIIEYTNFLPSGFNIKERLYYILYNVTNINTCQTCNNIIPLLNINGVIKQFCNSKCVSTNKLLIDKKKKLNQQKYGTDYYFQSPIGKENIKNTMICKHGVEYPMQSESIKQKNKVTLNERYGVDNISQLESTKDKKIKTLMKNYGVNHNMKSQQILNSRKATYLNNYGVDNPAKHISIKNKIKQTNRFRRNVDYTFQCDVIKQKIRNTNIDRYGVEFNSQKTIKDIIPLLNDFSYMETQYNKSSTIFLARKLKTTIKTVLKYLKKLGIKINRQNIISAKSIIWLEYISNTENIYIQHGYNGGEYMIPNTKYKVDGYCKETNTVYEFYGDYWHGNPEMINNKKFCKNKKLFSELYKNTIIREERISTVGYNIISIWEHEFDKNIKKYDIF